MDTIITGEGVELDARAASVASRLLGALIDLIISVALLVGAIVLLVNVVASSSSEAAARIGVIVTVVTVTLAVPTAVDTLTRGRSLGRLAVGIRVVRDDGGPITFRQAFVRALTGLLELWVTFGTVAVICSMVHPQGKRVGDILAGTYAVRVRGATAVRTPVLMPYELGAWAQHADVARLPDGLALAVRQFLARAPRLHHASRVELGTQLTQEVGRYVRPLPPAGTHPESFLAAVLAERRTRELRSEQVAEARREREAAALHRLPHGVPDPAR